MNRVWLLGIVILAGCTRPMPSPNPDKAWVALHLEAPSAASLLMADRLDDQRTADGRYFQVTPGAHELVVRYQFEMGGPLMGGGSLSSQTEPRRITCYMSITYEAFKAGERYQVRASSYMTEPRVVFLDRAGRSLGKVRKQQCLPY
ncbi:hypothetical protein IQ22_01027 [Pseudomonas duriflava]|uniref:Lipoprotein n=1 Tax=Pseudomonas duriflava TaxID=459528 RepID=A0A562QKK3_9PSED|nr:hypothetical protein [Pseudomonas duriflava]TWI56576.1 hypothetical protein IQ22_01027 [Pseudomonas duriflava]